MPEGPYGCRSSRHSRTPPSREPSSAALPAAPMTCQQGGERSHTVRHDRAAGGHGHIGLGVGLHRHWAHHVRPNACPARDPHRRTVRSGPDPGPRGRSRRPGWAQAPRGRPLMVRDGRGRLADRHDLLFAAEAVGNGYSARPLRGFPFHSPLLRPPPGIPRPSRDRMVAGLSPSALTPTAAPTADVAVCVCTVSPLGHRVEPPLLRSRWGFCCFWCRRIPSMP